MRSRSEIVMLIGTHGTPQRSEEGGMRSRSEIVMLIGTHGTPQRSEEGA